MGAQETLMKQFAPYPLKNHNTFGFDVTAKSAALASSVKDVQELARAGKLTAGDVLILGGGSNVLIVENPGGLTLLNQIKGIEKIEETADHITVKAGAGEVWHEFVMWAVNRGLGGVENLSLIPGNTGAAPMQNIGAYGVELNSVFQCLDAVNRKTGRLHSFTRKECEFDYRSSIFKTHARDEFVITAVEMRLSKKPKINTSYGAIEAELEKMKISNPTIKEVSEAVTTIRRSKLPDPKELGNSGSFFKNPIVTVEFYEDLANKHPDVIAYPVNGGMKLAAGRLIEMAGWKGKRFNRCGVHDKQALVLVNYGGATGQEVFELSTKIIDDIHSKYGITLEREVNVIPPILA